MNLIRKFMVATAGIAMVEFALALPVMMTLFYGTIEVTRYVLITQKVEKLAHSVADVIAQSSSVTIASLNQILVASSDIMNPYTMGANGRIIVSSLYQPAGGTPSVNWQYMGGGTLNSTSALGAVGTAPTMPVSYDGSVFTFDDRENVIAAEVFYRFSPLISSQWFGTTTVYRVAFYKPRLGTLTSTPV